MNEELQNLLLLSSERLTMLEVVFNFFICIVSSYLLVYVYNINAQTVSNKKLFSRIFPIYSIAIFGIITVIQSSLALSLGLVGALSIIRFRTAIKEPEQLIYLLMSTGIAIGAAAGQLNVVVISTIVFVIVTIIDRKLSKRKNITLSNEQTIHLKLDGRVDDTSNIINGGAKYLDGNHKLISFRSDNTQTNITLNASIKDLDGYKLWLTSLHPNLKFDILILQ
tara:strand:+ start:329 stop:997 length:669 start_codon:yes stop_codon:yes gene_type:complete